MMWFPFICLGIGALSGFIKFSDKATKTVEYIGNLALMVLMFTIGINIGADDAVITSIGLIGLQCAAIALLALFFSICFVTAIEKTVLPLDKLRLQMAQEQMPSSPELSPNDEKKPSPLVLLIPGCILAGVLTGYFLIPSRALDVVDHIFMVSLAILYVSVGMALAQNKDVFQYARLLGWKIILLSAAILLGSLVGGAFAAFLFNISPHVSILAAGGMSYYSITGAFMTQTYGIQAGTYGFLVNVLREFFTVLLLPILIRLGKGAPIASGAAGNMDTMLVPVTKFVGVELGFIALITGTILTFAVPVLLPILAHFFS